MISFARCLAAAVGVVAVVEALQPALAADAVPAALRQSPLVFVATFDAADKPLRGKLPEKLEPFHFSQRGHDVPAMSVGKRYLVAAKTGAAGSGSNSGLAVFAVAEIAATRWTTLVLMLSRLHRPHLVGQRLTAC